MFVEVRGRKNIQCAIYKGKIQGLTLGQEAGAQGLGQRWQRALQMTPDAILRRLWGGV
jgi:hypothetical protein